MKVGQPTLTLMTHKSVSQSQNMNDQPSAEVVSIKKLKKKKSGSSRFSRPRGPMSWNLMNEV